MSGPFILITGGQNFPCSFEEPGGFCAPDGADAGFVADSMMFGPSTLTDPPASWAGAISARPPAQPVPTSSPMFLALLALAMTVMGGFYLRSFRGSP